jgi:hypothetical protein
MVMLDESQAVLFGNNGNPVFDMVDQLAPGTQVPLMPYTRAGGGGNNGATFGRQ